MGLLFLNLYKFKFQYDNTLRKGTKIEIKVNYAFKFQYDNTLRNIEDIATWEDENDLNSNMIIL